MACGPVVHVSWEIVYLGTWEVPDAPTIPGVKYKSYLRGINGTLRGTSGTYGEVAAEVCAI